jgi:hypothetical protein
VAALSIRALSKRYANLEVLKGSISTSRAVNSPCWSGRPDAAVLVNNAANDQRQVLSEVTPAEFD